MEEQVRIERIKRESEQRNREQEENERRLLPERWRLESEAAAETVKQRQQRDRLLADKMQTQMNQNEVAEESRQQHRALLQQQERLNRELAVRLSEEVTGDDTLSTTSTGSGNRSGSSTPLPPAGSGPLQRSNAIMQQRSLQRKEDRTNPSNGKFDLSRWKYAELRDTINTSCDLELLEAC